MATGYIRSVSVHTRLYRTQSGYRRLFLLEGCRDPRCVVVQVQLTKRDLYIFSLYHVLGFARDFVPVGEDISYDL